MAGTRGIPSRHATATRASVLALIAVVARCSMLGPDFVTPDADVADTWITPLAVIFAVPLALLGIVGVLSALHVANNIYIQIGIVLLIALSSKNAILIVEYARDLHEREGMTLAAAATEAARLRFRPILMTSFAFILGVLPLVLATGAGASSRKSIGITVFSGMLASTCIAVLFVPSFFVLCQRLHEWRRRHKA